MNCSSCGNAIEDGDRCPSCEASAAPVTTLGEGSELLGKYRLGASLGVDGRYQVYAAEHLILGRPVHVHVLADELAAEREYVERYVERMRALVNLRDKRFIDVYECFDLMEGVGVVTAPFEGSTLADEVSKLGTRPFNIIRLKQWLVPALDSLHAFHEAGFVHGNPRFQSLARIHGGLLVKWVDLTHMRLKPPSLTSDSVPELSEVRTIAPEWLAEPKSVGPSADLYSVGCLLFRLVTGQDVFVVEDPRALMKAHLEETPREPRSLVPNLSDGLDRIIMRALSKHPNHRFESAAEMANALRDHKLFMRPVPIAAAPWSTTEIFPKANTLVKIPLGVPVGLPIEPPPPPKDVPTPGADGSLRSSAVVSTGSFESLNDLDAVVKEDSDGDELRDWSARGEVTQVSHAKLIKGGAELKKSRKAFDTQWVIGALVLSMVVLLIALIGALPGDDVKVEIDKADDAVETLLRREPPPDMAVIPAGPYLRGAEPGTIGWVNNQLATRLVFVNRFAIDRYEVPRVAYQACVDERLCVAASQPDVPTAQHLELLPVTEVSWEDAERYCKAQEKRLPTEAEWEKAAKSNRDWSFPWGDQFECGRANVSDPSCSGPKSRLEEVGRRTKGASSYGVENLAGNAWEWTADWYAEPSWFDENADASAVLGPPNGRGRVIKGGDFAAPYRSNAAREWNAPQTRSPNGGFRCAMDLAKDDPTSTPVFGNVLPNTDFEHFLTQGVAERTTDFRTVSQAKGGRGEAKQ